MPSAGPPPQARPYGPQRPPQQPAHPNRRSTFNLRHAVDPPAPLRAARRVLQLAADVTTQAPVPEVRAAAVPSSRTSTSVPPGGTNPRLIIDLGKFGSPPRPFGAKVDDQGRHGRAPSCGSAASRRQRPFTGGPPRRHLRNRAWLYLQAAVLED